MIRRISGIAGLLLTMGLLLTPAPTNAQKAPAKAQGPDIESDKLAPGTFTGKLKGAVLPGADFELEIEYKHLELKQGGKVGNNNNNQVQQLLRQQQQVAQAQQQIRRAKNPQEAARAMQQLQRTMAQMQQQTARQQPNQNLPFQVVTEKKNIDFHAATELVIRRTSVPNDLGFDEKGNVKVPTAEELKVLKGPNPKLPGFTGKVEDLKPGAVVVVTMRRAVIDPKVDPKDLDLHKNVVTMIVIEQDGQDAPTKGKKKN